MVILIFVFWALEGIGAKKCVDDYYIATANHDIHVALNSCGFSFKMTLGKVV